MLKSQPLVPQSMTLFENRVVADVISGDEVMLNGRGPPIQYVWCPQQKEKFGHRDTHTVKTPCEHEDGHRQTKERGLDRAFLPSPQKELALPTP